MANNAGLVKRQQNLPQLYACFRFQLCGAGSRVYAIAFCLRLLRLAALCTLALPCVALRLLWLKLHSAVASAGGGATSVFVVNGCDVLTSLSFLLYVLFAVAFISCATLASCRHFHSIICGCRFPESSQIFFQRFRCCTISTFCCFIAIFFLNSSAFGSKLLIKLLIYVCMYVCKRTCSQWSSNMQHG